jgi:5-methylcytosine-specific restriction protein A
LVRIRRKSRIPDLDDEALAFSNIDELRSVALLSQRKFVTPTERTVAYRARSIAIRLYVLRRAVGRCEGCKAPAPFFGTDGTPFLEAHHIDRLADDGPDHPRKVIGLCPNCHRRAHYSLEKDTFNRSLRKRLTILEPN